MGGVGECDRRRLARRRTRGAVQRARCRGGGRSGREHRDHPRSGRGVLRLTRHIRVPWFVRQDDTSPKETPMQYVLLIYQGTTPLPDTPEWSTLPEAEQRAIYADYAALNKTPNLTPG